MKVFISRILRPDSDFLTQIKNRGHDVHGESLVTFSAVPFDSYPESDWVFFYSKTGVRYFFEQADVHQLMGVRMAAIGEGTAKYMEKIYRRPEFSGDGDPLNTAASFLAVARGRRVLFPRAKDSRQSIQQLLGDKIEQHDLVVYENRARKDFELSFYDVLVFTSPLNAETYFEKYPRLKNQKIVAIGETTASKLADLNIKDIVIAESPSEEELAKTVLRMW